MTDRIRVSRVALALGLGLALAACSSMNKPLSKSYGVATKANMQAQIVPIDPGTVEQGPVPTSAERAAVARKAYDTGQVSDSVNQAEGTRSGK
jgi:pectin methylesterase-like acyl-CoA thioesterase